MPQPLPLTVARRLGKRTSQIPLSRISSCSPPSKFAVVQLVSSRKASSNATDVQSINSHTTGKRALATVRNSAAHLETDPHRERVVILGSGWGGYTFSREVSPKLYSPIVISPRTYFVFTPLLTDAAGGSIDFSNITEPIRDRSCKADYIQAAARWIDFKNKTVVCESTVIKKDVTETPRAVLEERTDEDRGGEYGALSPAAYKQQWERGDMFEIPYDKLVISVGAVARTFNTPGIKDNAMFFKDIGDARRVKRRVRECFELAALPTTTPEMRKWLLHFAIVGGGPTGTELAGSLRDFIFGDIIKLYPSLAGVPKITVYDVAPKVLSMFDESLSKYAMDHMRKEGIAVKTSHHIQSLRWGAPHTEGPHPMDPKGPLTITTKEEGEVGIGVCVWATGNAMRKLVRDSLQSVDTFPLNSVLMKDGQRPPDSVTKSEWQVKKSPRGGALQVDSHLRVQLENDKGDVAVLQDVFAIGDNAVPEGAPVPATAQATRQEAKWLATRFNQRDFATIPGFTFQNMGMLAYLGAQRGLMQLPQEGGQRSKVLPANLKGRTAWMVWNSAYIGMSISWRNKLRLIFRWTLNRLFGRDVSRF